MKVSGTLTVNCVLAVLHPDVEKKSAAISPVQPAAIVMEIISVVLKFILVICSFGQECLPPAGPQAAAQTQSERL